MEQSKEKQLQKISFNRDINIIYFGLGSFREVSVGKYEGKYYVILPGSCNPANYEFKQYNFSSASYNRILIHMHLKSGGLERDLSTDFQAPFFHEISINFAMGDYTRTPISTPLNPKADIDVMLYHNNDLDSYIDGQYDKFLEHILFPSRIGLGTFKKI